MSVVIYIGVKDPNYPRNRRVRSYLQSQDIGVKVVIDSELPRGRFRRHLGVLYACLRAEPQSVIVVSEFNSELTLAAWIGTRLRRKTLVVDCFVGKFETHVEDYAAFPSWSLRAIYFRVSDFLAWTLPDIVLIDTDARAEMLASRWRSSLRSNTVLTLPVGAPSWAATIPQVERLASLRILYYGNYIPLHGVATLLEGARLLRDAGVSFELRLIGGSDARAGHEEYVSHHSLKSCVFFEDPVPEAALAEAIRCSDVVIGVFGSSRKAMSVIPNKVWQGLESGRFVVTQATSALNEVVEICGDNLVQVFPSGAEIARALAAIALSDATPRSDVGDQLRAYVQQRFSLLSELHTESFPR